MLLLVLLEALLRSRRRGFGVVQVGRRSRAVERQVDLVHRVGRPLSVDGGRVREASVLGKVLAVIRRWRGGEDQRSRHDPVLRVDVHGCLSLLRLVAIRRRGLLLLLQQRIVVRQRRSLRLVLRRIPLVVPLSQLGLLARLPIPAHRSGRLGQLDDGSALLLDEQVATKGVLSGEGLGAVGTRPGSLLLVRPVMPRQVVSSVLQKGDQSKQGSALSTGE